MIFAFKQISFNSFTRVSYFKHNHNETTTAINSFIDLHKQRTIGYIANTSHHHFHTIGLPVSGEQPTVHFGGTIFMNFYSMTSLCLITCGTTFSQTVTDKVFSAAFAKMNIFQHRRSQGAHDPQIFSICSHFVL